MKSKKQKVWYDCDILVPDLENRQMEYEVRRTIVVSRAKLSRAKKTKATSKNDTKKARKVHLNIKVDHNIDIESNRHQATYSIN